jgi:hypothetical protein
MNNNIVICPNCNEPVIIEKLNCGIFRHGIVKRTGQNINPHASKKTCEKLINKNLIYGCGKPFKIIINQLQSGDSVVNTCIQVQTCDYI